VAEPLKVPPAPARERILESAYELFSRHGLRAVVIDRASVAKATLYRHFASKDELVLEFLRRREDAREISTRPSAARSWAAC